jgi:hypothetical protein
VENQNNQAPDDFQAAFLRALEEQTYYDLFGVSLEEMYLIHGCIGEEIYSALPPDEVAVLSAVERRATQLIKEDVFPLDAISRAVNENNALRMFAPRYAEKLKKIRENK